MTNSIVFVLNIKRRCQNKATDIELKYRITNYSEIEGYKWYGDIWYNIFNSEIKKVNETGRTINSSFFFSNENTVFEEGIFLKLNNELLFTKEIARGKSCNIFLPFLSTTEQLPDNSLLEK